MKNIWDDRYIIIEIGGMKGKPSTSYWVIWDVKKQENIEDDGVEIRFKTREHAKKYKEKLKD